VTLVEAIAVLNRWADDAKVRVSQLGKDFFEIDHEFGDRRIFLVFKEEISNKVTTVNYSVIVGEIADKNALLPILSRNRGGVMDSEFFFSTRQLEGHHALFLETTQYNIHLSQEGLRDLLDAWWVHPFWVREWDFPQGVTNFLWD
jgi:hypothetical protein